ncbi:MAG: universal stress protein [Candidatus Cybelea sp.]|jgi:nucleotide-binding universal stress UspA family protein
MFKRIAVALDGSDCAAEALTVALQLAQSEQSELGMCSVVDPIVIAGTTPPSPAMDLVICDMEVEARRLVGDAVERAHQLGLTASGHACSGVPAFEILKYAQSFRADLIVMGTHGRKGIGHLLMGSVAEIILRESPIPVLVVRGARKSRSK